MGSKAICTCGPGRMTVCHDPRYEPHYAGCSRWGTPKPDRDVLALGICPRSGAPIMPGGNLRPACAICNCGEAEL